MRRKQYYIPLICAFMIIVLGIVFINLHSASAQSNRYPTPQEALESVLKEYLRIANLDSELQLGEVEVNGNFALSLARGEILNGDYPDYVLLLAEEGTDNLWFAAAPKVVGEKVYNDLLSRMPLSLLDEFEKSYFYQYNTQEISILMTRALSLHHLPWPIRETARLTQKDSTYHINQLDFVLRDSSSVYASKPGIVVFVKESSNIGGCDIDFWPYANMVVVQHSPSEYSWYVHLVKDSVPVAVGDLIGYGTKIGTQGNTGFSCGSSGIHLHYMASTAIPNSWPNPTVPNYAPWPPGGSIITVDFIEAAWSALVVDRIYSSQNAPPPGICNTPSTEAIFFDNTYCSGQIIQKNAEGLVNLELVDLDDKIESAAIPLGWSVALYKDENEIGPSLCLNQSDQMLWDNQFSDQSVVANQVSWFRLYKQANCPYPDELGIKLFPEINFGGTPLWGMVGARFTNGPHVLAQSIYIPDGFSVRIYDANDAGGNGLCFSASVLDLSEFGWIDHYIESLELFVGNNCETYPGDVPQPILVSPLNDEIIYGPNSPEVCWQVKGGVQDLVFKAIAYNDTTIVESAWMVESCWQIEGLAGQYGNYSWRVQAKNTQGVMGQWSLTNRFSYLADTFSPTAQIITPLDNSLVKWPRANLIVNATDAESGVARVYFLAWYDDGTGKGYDWHLLGVDENPADGWSYVWNLTVVQSKDAAVWVYVEDFGGNFGSIYVNGIQVVYSIKNENGFEYREGVEKEPLTGSDNSFINPDEQMEDQVERSSYPNDVISEPMNTGAEAIQDTELPLVKILSPVQGARIADSVSIDLEVLDTMSGVASVYLMAWYDAGDGTGYAWHTIWETHSVAEGLISYEWEPLGLNQEGIHLWVYVRDKAGNLASTQVSEINLQQSQHPKAGISKSLYDIIGSTKP